MLNKDSVYCRCNVNLHTKFFNIEMTVTQYAEPHIICFSLFYWGEGGVDQKFGNKYFNNSSVIQHTLPVDCNIADVY